MVNTDKFILCLGELAVPQWRSNSNQDVHTEGGQDGDNGFQHADIHVSGEEETVVAAVDDEALELAYQSLVHNNNEGEGGEEGELREHHVQGLKGFENGEFKELDTDGDGTVTLEEFKKHAREKQLVNSKHTPATGNFTILIHFTILLF